MKLKKILKEHAYLGQLPSSKLKKMKWNPVTDKQPVREEQLNEEYIELMRLSEPLTLIRDEWLNWKNGPMTEPSDIKPAQKELMNYIIKWMKKNIK